MEDTQTKIVCPYCDSHDTQPFGRTSIQKISPENKDQVFYQCHHCSLIFKDLNISSEKKFYEGTYHQKRYSSGLSDTLKNFPAKNSFKRLVLKTIKRLVYLFQPRHPIYVPWLKDILDVSRQQKINKSALEIGCGISPLLDFETFGFEYHMLEPCNDIVERFQQLGYTNAAQGFSEDLSQYPDGKFGMVLYCKSLCASHDLKKTVQETHRILEPGGLFVICDTKFEESPIDTGLSFYNHYISEKWIQHHLEGFKVLLFKNLEENLKVGDRFICVCQKDPK